MLRYFFASPLLSPDRFPRNARHFTPAVYSSNSLYSPVSVHRSESLYSMS